MGMALISLVAMIAVVGAGKVGSATAFDILKDHIGDVVIIDLNAELVGGEALEMMKAVPAIEFDVEFRGSKDLKEMEGSEPIIVISGQSRNFGMKRLDLINTNAKILCSIIKEVERYAPDCKYVIPTNLVDIMTFIALKESGLPPNRVFGMGNILDTLRINSYIAEELGISKEAIQALVIGKRYQSLDPPFEYASVLEILVITLLSKKQIENVVNRTVTSKTDVIKLKGVKTYASVEVIMLIAESVLKGRNRLRSITTCPKGEYECYYMSIGVPVVLGKISLERITELKLSPESKLCFGKSVAKVKNTIASLKY